MKSEKKYAVMLLSVLFLAGCGNGEKITEVQTESTQETEAVEEVSTYEVRQDIQEILALSKKASMSSAVAIDGTMYNNNDRLKDDVPFYSTLDIKKLTAPSHSYPYLALTTDGKLYLGENLCAENVAEVEYCTNNSDPYGYLFDNDGKVYKISSEYGSGELEIKDYSNLGTFQNISYVTAEKHDFVIVYNDGTFAFMPDRTSTMDWEEYDFSSWKNIAVIAMAKDSQASPKENTIAGISGDGTVQAYGTYADEILSWGELKYIDMCGGNIVGVTPEGKLKITGKSGQGFLNCYSVDDWNPIVSLCVDEDQFVATDVNGGVYMVDTRGTGGSYSYTTKEGGIHHSSPTETRESYVQVFSK